MSAKIEVWRFDLSEHPEGPDPWSILSNEETDRANRFRFDRHRNRYVRCRARLRQLIAARLGEAETPHQIRFADGEHGKPFLPEHATLHFNVSHSGDIAVIAVSDDCEVGVDVERWKRRLRYKDLSERFYTPSECKALGAASSAESEILFYRIWTAKEARMKVTGEGLSLDPRKIKVLISDDFKPHAYAPEDDGINAGWILHACDLNDVEASFAVTASKEFEVAWR